MSPEPNPRLLELADRIGARQAVDWQREFLSSSDLQELKILQSLETLGRIGNLHASEARAPEARQWGRLRILSELGRGSFGVVWRAHDPDLQRDVALKLLDPARTQREDQRAQILREARCLARVRHENVVSVHGVETHDGQVGLWMELIEGKSLAQLLRENGPLSEGELRSVGASIARAVAAIHREGVLHRDLKPQNILRESGGRIVLMDLGAGSRNEDRALPTIGTPLYLAPELLAGGPAAVASDLYALGVTLFNLATARHPIEAQSVAELRQASTRLRLADLRPDLSPTLVQCIERCLLPEPNQRWPSAGALALELGGEERRPRQSTAARRRWWASAAIVLLATLASFAVRQFLLSSSHFELDAAVFRWTASGREELDPGATLGPEDAIGLRLRSDRALHVYVLNEDDAGRTRLLFPLPWLELRNPLAGGAEHRLPGAARGEERAWGMSEQAQHERLLLIASPKALAELEQLVSTLSKSEMTEDTVLDVAALEALRRRFRGLGKLVSVPSASVVSPSGSLDSIEALLRGAQRADGIWIRRFDYQSRP